jgi:hypothetical protein
VRTPAFSQERLKRRSAKSNGSLSFTFTDGILNGSGFVQNGADIIDPCLQEADNYKEAAVNINRCNEIKLCFL